MPLVRIAVEGRLLYVRVEWWLCVTSMRWVVRWSDGKCSAVRWPMQCTASADEVHSDDRCSALRFWVNCGTQEAEGGMMNEGRAEARVRASAEDARVLL